MSRSRIRIAASLALAASLFVAVSAAAQSGRALLELATRHERAGEYDEARAALKAAASESSGEVRREAWFRLAGLESTASEAESIYRRVIDDDPGNDWAKRSQLELAKIQYALGNYNAAYHILDDSDACDVSDEACLFHGLSAIMLERYDDARGPLSRVGQGRLRSWAYLSLAEVDAGEQRQDAACERYESLSNAMISPTALYRYGECLEDRGDVEAARREYRELIRNFRDTPEAVLAAEKLQVIETRPANPTKPSQPAGSGEQTPSQTAPEDHAGSEVLESGFTVQFGSFRDRGNAIKLAAKVKSVFPGVRVDSELVQYREHYRVRYGYFHTRDEAQAMGQRISREVNVDFTIMPLP